MTGLRPYSFSGFAVIFFVLIEVAPLVSGRPFYTDWINHVWLIEYVSRYVEMNHAFPATIDHAETFGNPMPLFYGMFFYPLLSLPALVLGSDLTIRLFMAGVLIAPVWTYYRLFKQWTASHDMAVYLSLIANFSIYQLSNLYARGALTEIAAYQSLILGLSLILLGVTADRTVGTASLTAGMVWVLFAVGTHPITFYMVLLFGVPVVLACLAIDRTLVDPRRWRLLLALSSGAALLMLPWVMLTLTYKDQFYVFRHDFLAKKLFYFPRSIDSLWAKFGLFYTDGRIFDTNFFTISTPFLDAPLPVLTLVMICVLLWILRLERPQIFRPMAVLVLAVSVSIVAICIPPESAIANNWNNTRYVTQEHGLIYQFLFPIQFVYRLSGIAALCLVVILVTVIHLLSPTYSAFWQRLGLRLISSLLIGCVLLSALYKMILVVIEHGVVPHDARAQSLAVEAQAIDARALMITTEDYRALIQQTDRLPFTFYGERGYAMHGTLAVAPDAESADRQIRPLAVSAFDTPVVVTCDRPCLIRSNILPSLLYRVVVDGREPEHVSLSASENLQFPLPEGQHRISVEWVESKVRLLSLSVWGFLAVFVVSMGWLLHHALGGGEFIRMIKRRDMVRS